MEDELNSPLNHSSSGIEIFFRTGKYTLLNPNVIKLRNIY